MNKLIINLDIVLKISEYLLEPSILIQNHYYDNNGNFKIILDQNFANNQIKDYINILHRRYFNKNIDFLKIINDINNINKYWRYIQHTIYIDYKYVYNNWKKSYLYQLDYGNQLNDGNQLDYGNQFLNNEELSISTFKNYQYKMNSAIYNINLDFKLLETNLELFYKKIKIEEYQFKMKYWNSYFQIYLEDINYDFNKFKVSHLIKFIKTEERILYGFLFDLN